MSDKNLIPWARAVCYSGYRENQSPRDNTFPTKSQIKEDLEIILKHEFSYIRMYDANAYAEMVCQVIQEESIPLNKLSYCARSIINLSFYSCSS